MAALPGEDARKKFPRRPDSAFKGYFRMQLARGSETVKGLRIICIGRLKAPWCQEACHHYLALLHNMRKVEITELRDGSVQGSPEAKRSQEGKRICESFRDGDLNIALDVAGKPFTSPQLAEFLRTCDERLHKRPTFIVGGPFGLDNCVLARCELRLSLSMLTFPHELARLILYEQLYRAESILRNSPYHH